MYLAASVIDCAVLVACCREAMLAALKSGTTLVVDRYSYSGVVFTSAKQLPGLDLSWCKVHMHGDCFNVYKCSFSHL